MILRRRESYTSYLEYSLVNGNTIVQVRRFGHNNYPAYLPTSRRRNGCDKPFRAPKELWI